MNGVSVVNILKVLVFLFIGKGADSARDGSCRPCNAPCADLPMLLSLSCTSMSAHNLYISSLYGRPKEFQKNPELCTPAGNLWLLE